MELADGSETGFLERPDGRGVVGVRICDASLRRRCSEDDVVHELREDSRPEAAPGLGVVGEEEIDTSDTWARADGRLVLRVVGNEIGLDETCGFSADLDHVQVGRVVTANRWKVVLDDL